jgi:hypothetical protein
MKSALFALLFVTTSSWATMVTCHPASKNPICWESTPSVDSKPNPCQSYSKCTKIKTVTEVVGGHECIDNKNKKFDCTKIVEQYGTYLEGMSVKIKVASYDVCHIPGACGSKSCIEKVYALIDLECRD